MNENKGNRWLSAIIGFSVGVVSFVVTAATAVGVSVATAAGAAAFTPAGIFVVAVLAGVGTLAATTAVGALCSRNIFKPVLAFVSGLAPLAAGIGMFFGLSNLTLKSVLKSPMRIPAPVENTSKVSFTGHKNAFNASALHSNKKTLVLTAQDFSRAPAPRA